jgi:hypothetical protein
VLQSEVYRNVHVGTRHNLDSGEGIRSALEEIDSVRRSLQQRLRTYEQGGELEEVDSEGSSVVFSAEDEEEDEDEDEEMEDVEEREWLGDPFEDVEEDAEGEEEDDDEDSFEGFSD